MATTQSIPTPNVGDWYRETDTRQEFQVIDLDPEDGLIEVQYFDGDIDAFTFEEWRAHEPQPIGPPEDWTGPMDSLEQADVDYDEEPSGRVLRERRNPSLERDRILFDEEGGDSDVSGADED